MYTQDPGRIKLKIINIMPATWFGRLLATMLGLLLIWLAAMFFMLFLPLLALAVGMMVLRMLWLTRQRTNTAQDFIEADYRVEKSNQDQGKDDWSDS